MAAITAAMTLGVKFKIIKKSLEEFAGIWRRFEIIGEYKGAIIISDYGHHPTAIKETLKAAKEFYPDRRLVIVFQPHSRNRTQKLFTEFVKSFDDADLVILPEIYDVEGRENSAEKISSRELVYAIQNWQRTCCRVEASACVPHLDKLPRLRGTGIFYAKDLNEGKKILLKNIRKNDVVIIMGAGDVYKLKV
ncbi:MAG: cyanophycin synthetase, partial [bacterium]